MKICWKASEVSWWMEPSGAPLSTPCTPSEEYWRPPSEFSKGEPLATSSARPKAKNPWGLWPLRVFGLWSGLGCGLGFAFRKSLGGPSIFSLGSTLSTLGNSLKGLHSPCYLLGFPTDCPTLPSHFFSQIISQWITKVFVEQPRLHKGSVKNVAVSYYLLACVYYEMSSIVKWL